MSDPKPSVVLAEILDLAKNEGDLLFRGHQEIVDGDPVPKVFREHASRRIRHESIPCGFEPMLGHEFRDYAHSVHPNCPADAEHFEWLALMRHCEAPTRLLDWTRSVLVATYFAVEECDKASAAEILILNAGELTKITREAHELTNHQSSDPSLACMCKDHPINNEGVPFSIGKSVGRLAEQAFADHRFRRGKTCQVFHTCRFPLVAAPPRTFSRLATQRSWFTIHPTPRVPTWARPEDERIETERETLTLSEIKRDGASILKRYEIPAIEKQIIRHALGALGITRATLFADLDGLARSLIPELERRFPQRI